MVKFAIALAAIASALLSGIYAATAGMFDADTPAKHAPPIVRVVPDWDRDGIREVETHPGERIEEDDPRWDCRTMGNLTCGDTYYG